MGTNSRITRKFTRVKNDIIRLVKLSKLFFCRYDKHITHKKRMVCPRTDNTNLNTIFFIPAGKTINNIQTVTGIEIINRTLTVMRERNGIRLHVDAAPPNILIRFRIFHNAFIFRAAASFHAGICHQRTCTGNFSCIVSKRLGVKDCRYRVPKYIFLRNAIL